MAKKMDKQAKKHLLGGGIVGGLLGATFKGGLALIGLGAAAGLGGGVLLHHIYKKRKSYLKLAQLKKKK